MPLLNDLQQRDIGLLLPTVLLYSPVYLYIGREHGVMHLSVAIVFKSQDAFLHIFVKVHDYHAYKYRNH